MPRESRDGRYHHGDLKAALVAAAVELIGERGLHGFSLAETSRRLGVAPSAPYAHFTDREDLLAAVAVYAHERFFAELQAKFATVREPAGRLAAMARAYVRFAAANPPLFGVLHGAGLDKSLHPEIAAAEGPINDAFLACVGALRPGDAAASESLAAAIEATAHGHAVLLLDGGFGQGDDAAERAAESAERATLALVESRHLLAGAR